MIYAIGNYAIYAPILLKYLHLCLCVLIGANRVYSIIKKNALSFKFKDMITSLWNDFIYSGHIFALGAVSVAIMVSFIFSISLTWDYLLIIYFTFYTIYFYDYLSDAEGDICTFSKRAEYHLKSKSVNDLLKYNQGRAVSSIQDKEIRDKKCPCTLCFNVLIIISTYYVYSNSFNMFIGLMILSLGIFYPLYFKGITKKIPAFKDIFVSLIWAFLIYLMHIYYGQTISISAIYLSIFIFLKMGSIQLFFDIRDVDADRKHDLLTIPVLLGNKNSITIFRILNVATLFVLIVGVYTKLFPAYMLVLILVFFYSMMYERMVKIFNNEPKYYLLAAGEPLLWVGLVYVGMLGFSQI